MARRGLIIASILGLISLAVLAGRPMRSSVATAEEVSDDPAAEAKADFEEMLALREPGVLSSAVSALSAAENYADIPFPHVAMYGGANSAGWPFVGSWGTITNTPGLPLNQEAINDYSRFPMIILPATPLVDGRPDIVDAFRATNPSNKLVAYLMGHTTWCGPDVNGDNGYPTNYYYRHYWLAATGGDPQCDTQSNSLLWMQDGIRADLSPHVIGTNVNLAHRVQNPDNSFTYDVAENLANIMFDDVYQSGKFDGIFIDVFCSTVDWMQDADSKFDYVRAGYNDGIADNGDDNLKPAVANAFYAGWTEGHRIMGKRLRSLIDAAGGSDYPIMANCGQGPASLYPDFNGWMRENFPYQNGSTWYSNMYRQPGGYLFEEYSFRSPQMNHIFTGAEPSTDPYSSFNQRKMRFGLASASLGNGWFAFEDTVAAPQIPPPPNLPYAKWWFDEYGVDRVTGTATPGLNRGWLGQARTDAYQVIATNANPELMPTNDFTSNTTGWQLNIYGSAGATMTRDTTTGGSGSESIKAHITAIDTYDYAVSLNSTNNLPVFNANEYSITFWAKADRLRAINVTLDHPPGNVYASQNQPITTEWKRYQVRLKPSTSDASASFRFSLGQEIGDVWIDDVHVQIGITSVFRRDFDHGIVLLNPSNAAVTVPLEKPYKKILGTANPSVNTGDVVSSVTLAGANSGSGNGDALFLLDIDITPPGTTNDFR